MFRITYLYNNLLANLVKVPNFTIYLTESHEDNSIYVVIYCENYYYIRIGIN